jgi:hypothetical protein
VTAAGGGPVPFHAGRLRAGRAFELVPLERMTPAERALCAEATAPAELYGMLRPDPGAGLEPRAASPDTALLFLTLALPGPLPAYARAALGEAAADTVTRLVLDGVLEFEHRGEWVSGRAAAALLTGGGRAVGRGRIAELSVAAVRYGQELGDLPEELLALRLYGYGRRPVGPEQRRRLPDEAAVTRALGLAPDGAARRTLAAGWREAPPRAQGRTYWRHWRPRLASGDGRRRRANYKLYVSPSLAALPATVAITAEVLTTAAPATAFKIGADLSALCRPDKFVVYFDRLDDLSATAGTLADRLAGQAAHGVPFTAAVTEDGLLSWGTDPPTGVEDGPPGSWRLWVARRLAEHLAAARRGAGGLEPWRFALERLRVSGVDVDSWVPTGALWSRAAVSG